METFRMNRKAELIKLLELEPKDSFLRYACALEIGKEGDLDSACELLEQLKSDDPNYLGLYHQLANYYLQQNKEEQALAILEEGIELAKKAGNKKAQNEMSELHWMYSDDD